MIIFINSHSSGGLSRSCSALCAVLGIIMIIIEMRKTFQSFVCQVMFLMTCLLSSEILSYSIHNKHSISQGVHVPNESLVFVMIVATGFI